MSVCSKLGVVPFILVTLVATSLLPSLGCRSSKTVDELKAFADKVCACTDAACATQVAEDYRAWSKTNKRARGSDTDKKSIETILSRYAQCHAKLVPVAKAKPMAIPKVNLAPPASVPGKNSPGTTTPIAPSATSGVTPGSATPVIAVPVVKPDPTPPTE